MIAGGGHLDRARPRRRLSARRLRRLLAAVLAVDLVVFNVFVIRSAHHRGQGARPTGRLSASLQAHGGRRPVHHLRPRPVRHRPALRLGPDRPQHLRRAAQRPGLHRADRRRLLRRHRRPLTRRTSIRPPWPAPPGTTSTSPPCCPCPGYFVTPLPSPAPGPTVAHADAVRFPGHIAVYNSSPAPVATSYGLTRGPSRTWYFGGVLTVDRLAVPLLAGVAGRPAGGPGDRHRRGPLAAVHRHHPDPVDGGHTLARRRPCRAGPGRRAGRRVGGGRALEVGDPDRRSPPRPARWPSTAGCSSA